MFSDNNINLISYVRLYCLVIICSFMTIFLSCNTVYAANADITFGSDSYTANSGGTFPIGVYLNSNESTGEFVVNLTYDNKRLVYESGASSVDADKGIITIKGNSINAGSTRYWLQFRAVSGGDAFIKVRDYTVKNSGNNSNATVTAQSKAPIHISGNDTVGYDVERALEGTATNQNTNETDYTDDEEVDDYYEENDESDRGFFASIWYVIADFMTALAAKPVAALFMILSLASVAVIVFILVYYFKNKDNLVRDENIEIKSNNKDDNRNNIVINTESLTSVPKVVDNKRLKDIEREGRENLGKIVIRIKHVSMVYTMSGSDASGLKEYIIQWIKHQVEYSKLYALRDVSFNVYRGEVVGIIGSNGSGKSTLLKIVSGALKPTWGNVDVNRRKIQILTLGTGFDYELTARENVYLNGAIIGYSREFLDSHYDEIVKFAELEDFMDQKVKTFSSGMVSRLGFAIATAGDAAEILILDEVLSVGDESFRKKSLARIKEMIHGGSTVLMVSHGMQTIIDNCTKCVWIEKGILKMIDEPKIVCEAYRNYADG